MAKLENGELRPESVEKANSEAFDRIRDLVDELGVVVKHESALLDEQTNPLLKEPPLVRTAVQNESH